jgi:hypothetical protein
MKSFNTPLPIQPPDVHDTPLNTAEQLAYLQQRLTDAEEFKKWTESKERDLLETNRITQANALGKDKALKDQYDELQTQGEQLDKLRAQLILCNDQWRDETDAREKVWTDYVANQQSEIVNQQSEIQRLLNQESCHQGSLTKVPTESKPNPIPMLEHPFRLPSFKPDPSQPPRPEGPVDRPVSSGLPEKPLGGNHLEEQISRLVTILIQERNEHPPPANKPKSGSIPYKMPFTKFNGKDANYKTFMRSFLNAFKHNGIAEASKGQFLLSMLEGKAQEAVSMIQEPDPSFEKVKNTLDLLYLEKTNTMTKLTKLDNLELSQFTDPAKYAHELVVQVAECFPGLGDKEQDEIVKAKFLKGLPETLQTRYDATLYSTTAHLVQSVQQGLEMAKGSKTPTSSGGVSGSTTEGEKPLVKPLAPIMEASAPIAVNAVEEMASQFDILFHKMDNMSRDVAGVSRDVGHVSRDVGNVSRDVANQRPTSPYRPTSSLSNISSWTQDSYRPPSSANTYGGGGTSYRATGATGYQGKPIKNWVPMSETYNYRNNPGPRNSTPKFTPSGGNKGGSNNQGGARPPCPPPPHYTGGYKGKNFDEVRWAKDILNKQEKMDAKLAQQEKEKTDPKTAGDPNSQGGARTQTSGPP